jgi:hypothetical protein
MRLPLLRRVRLQRSSPHRRPFQLKSFSDDRLIHYPAGMRDTTHDVHAIEPDEVSFCVDTAIKVIDVNF